MRVIYMAHPVSGDVEGNLIRAKLWQATIELCYPDVAVVANWIVECEIWGDANDEQRAAGLRRDMAVLGRCDEIWLCGVPEGDPTAGMAAELEAARAAGLRVRWCGVTYEAFREEFL